MDKKNFPCCGISLLENMDPRSSVRITMLSSSSIRKRLRLKSQTMYLRVGNMVFVMSNCPRQASPLTIAQDTLIALVSAQRFLNFHGQKRSRYIPRILERHRMKRITKILSRSTMTQLAEESLKLTDVLSNLLPRFRFNLLYSPNVTDMAFQVIYSILYGIDSMNSYRERYAEAQRKKSQKTT